LFLGAATGPWVIDGGYIEGGNVAFPQGYLSLTSNQNNTIHNATTGAACFLSGGYLLGDSFHPTAGLTITGGADIWLVNPGSMGNVSVSDSTLTLNGGSAFVTSLALNNSNLNIRQSGVSMALVPHVTRTGTTAITCVGVMTNTGLTTSFNDSTGVWNMNGCRVDNGTINIVNSNLVFNSSSANLFNNVTIGTDLNMNGGRLTLSGGHVNGAVVLSGGANLSFASSPLPPNVSAAGGSSVTVSGTYTASGQINITGGSSLTLQGTWNNTGTITITDSTLNLGGDFTAANLGNVVRSNATVNLTGNLNNTGSTLTLNASTGNWNLAGTGSTIASITGGTVATSGGALLTTAPNTTVNRLTDVAVQGDLYMSPGSALLLQGNWSNSGAITVDNATLQLGGTFAGTSVGNVARLGASRVMMVGTMNNAGQTLTLNSATGSWEMNHGTINGGTVNLTQGSTLLFNAPEEITQYRSGTLSGVTVNGDISLPDIPAFTNVHPTLVITNGLNLNGSISSLGRSNLIYAFGTQTVTGGTINLNTAATAGFGSVLFGVDTPDSQVTPTLTLSSTTLVRGGNAELRSASSNFTGLVNNGRISADLSGLTLAVSNETIVSNGTLEAVDGGILSIWAGSSGTVTCNGVLRAATGGVINLGANGGNNASVRFGPAATIDTAGGTVNILGTIDNTNNTLNINASAGSWRFSDGRIHGGNVTFGQGGGLSVLSGHTGTLDGVTLTGTISPLNGLHIWNDFTLNGTLTLTTSGTTVAFSGNPTATMTGGTIALMPIDGTFPGIVSVPVAGTLTLSPTTIIHGGGAFSSTPTASIGTYTGTGGSVIINQGLISADINQRELTIKSDSFINQGIVEARDGGQIKLPDLVHNSWSNQGTIRLINGGTAWLGGQFTSDALGQFDGAGGHTYVAGVMDNSSRTWTLTPAMGPWTLTSYGEIKGGTVNVQPGASLSASSVGRLDNVTLNGDISVTSGSLNVGNGLNLNGTIHLSGPGSQVSFYSVNALTLASGTIAFDNLAGTPTQLSASADSGHPLVFTLGPGAVVHGGTAAIFTSASLGSTIINQGLISADRPGEAITIYLERFQNEGTVQAINNAQIVFVPPPPLAGGGGSLYNSGLLDVALASRMDIDGALAQGPNGTLSFWIGPDGASSSLWASEVDAAGTLRVSLAPGFVPGAAESFRVLQFDTILGTFGQVDLPALPSGLAWDTSSLYSDGTFRVVPAPAGVALGLAAGLLAARRRRTLSAQEGRTP
jgi:hypothetical protein